MYFRNTFWSQNVILANDLTDSFALSGFLTSYCLDYQQKNSYYVFNDQVLLYSINITNEITEPGT